MSLVQLIYNGIEFGSIILLAAIGLSLLYGIGNFPNFAHGELLALGAYTTFLLYTGFGLPFVLSVILATVLVAGLGAIIDRSIISRHRESSSLTLLLITVGVAFIIRSILRIIWESKPRSYNLPLKRNTQIIDHVIYIGGYDLSLSLSISVKSLSVILVGIFFASLTHIFLTRTKIGVAMRATSANKSLSKVTGIDTEFVATITWVLAAGLGAISGVVLAYSTGVIYPRMGFELLLVVFAAVILGGIGSPYGAMLGAYLISIAQEFSILIPGVGARYRLAVAFIIMVATLMFKPTGILGEEWKQ